jgi:cholesterol oxidase
VAVNFDAIVIGSGFGGAVAACRLSEAGYKVLVLERGRRWDETSFPSVTGKDWLWDQYKPEKSNGWADLRMFPNMSVATAAGVGGGSLIYANVFIEAKPHVFEKGWPPEITYEELKPYYDVAGEMLNVRKLPTTQWTARTHLVKEAAEKIGHGDKFELVDLAVAFDDEWTPDQPDAMTADKSLKFTNAEGRPQGTCVHLGQCDLGCPVLAKNTVDLNYLARAEDHGAEVRPLHVVNGIGKQADGYSVAFDRIEDGEKIPGTENARIVILSAGSIGTTELLLRSRDEHGTLPELGPRVGVGWSSNGDFVTPAFHPGREVKAYEGVTISSAIDFLGDRSYKGHEIYIEDGGIPNIFRTWIEKGAKGVKKRSLRGLILWWTLRRLLKKGPLPTAMVWFAQAKDAADGKFTLRKRWRLFGKKKLHLDWDLKASRKTMDGVVDLHAELAKATGGYRYLLPTWRYAKDLVTPHPLGGANMGTEENNGVVNHAGEVFGHRNLFVMDGAVIPEAIGLNPSRTIAALAERNVKKIIEEGR